MSGQRLYRNLFLSVAAVAPCAFAAAQSVTRGPYLQSGSDSAVVVRWRTDAATDSRVRYGTQFGNLGSIADDPAVTGEHVVQVSGLSADTKYYYSIGSSSSTLAGDDAGHFFVTSPTPGAAKPTRIWVLGDPGTGYGGQLDVRDSYYAFTGSRHTDLWLLLGDNAYEDGTDSEYQAKFFDIYPEMLHKSVVWPTFGNHDGHSADSGTQSGPYYDMFTLPKNGEAGGVASGTEAYYSFDYANVHFVCLDSYDSSPSTSGAMLQWLAQDLAVNTSEWLIAFWHHPPLSKGSHDSDSSGTQTTIRENFLPILEDAGADLVLCGHSHGYERSFLIDGHYGYSNTFNSSHQVDGGDGRIDGDGAYRKASGPHGGTVYIVSGASGYASGSGTLDHPAMFVSMRQLGSLVLDVDGGQLDIKYLDDNGNWDTRDHLTLIKGTGGGLPPVANFRGTPTSGDEPLEVLFTDLSTGAPSSWAWDFGDGGFSTAQNPDHVYTDQGTYDVSLTATNANGTDTVYREGYVVVSSSSGRGWIGWGAVDPFTVGLALGVGVLAAAARRRRRRPEAAGGER
jgi:hypothetical protein